jgi:hypothetical protein
VEPLILISGKKIVNWETNQQPFNFPLKHTALRAKAMLARSVAKKGGKQLAKASIRRQVRLRKQNPLHL